MLLQCFVRGFYGHLSIELHAMGSVPRMVDRGERQTTTGAHSKVIEEDTSLNDTAETGLDLPEGQYESDSGTSTYYNRIVEICISSAGDV